MKNYLNDEIKKKKVMKNYVKIEKVFKIFTFY